MNLTLKYQNRCSDNESQNEEELTTQANEAFISYMNAFTEKDKAEILAAANVHSIPAKSKTKLIDAAIGSLLVFGP